MTSWLHTHRATQINESISYSLYVHMYLICKGLKLEFGKNKTVVRYHPAPVLPPADQPEANNNTSCSGKQPTSSSNYVIMPEIP